MFQLIQRCTPPVTPAVFALFCLVQIPPVPLGWSSVFQSGRRLRVQTPVFGSPFSSSNALQSFRKQQSRRWRTTTLSANTQNRHRPNRSPRAHSHHIANLHLFRRLDLHIVDAHPPLVNLLPRQRPRLVKPRCPQPFVMRSLSIWFDSRFLLSIYDSSRRIYCLNSYIINSRIYLFFIHYHPKQHLLKSPQITTINVFTHINT